MPTMHYAWITAKKEMAKSSPKKWPTANQSHYTLFLVRPDFLFRDIREFIEENSAKLKAVSYCHKKEQSFVFLKGRCGIFLI